MKNFPEESQILVYLFSAPTARDLIAKWVKVEYFAQPQLKDLYERMIKLPLEDLEGLRAIDFADLFSEYSGIIMELLDEASEYRFDAHSVEKAQALSLQLIKKNRKTLPQQIRMAGSQGDERLVQSLMAEQKEVTALIRQLDHRNPKNH